MHEILEVEASALEQFDMDALDREILECGLSDALPQENLLAKYDLVQKAMEKKLLNCIGGHTIENVMDVLLALMGRFRTAVKDPLDLVFMFWSISVGIICGAGMIGLAVILTVVATVLVVVFYKLPEARSSMILVVNATSSECLEHVFQTVEKYDKKYNVKSRNLTKESADLLMEIRLKDCDGLLKELNEIKEVASVSMVAHKGEAVY